MIYTRELINPKDLNLIQELIPKLEWEDGMVTATTYFDDTKKLHQALPSRYLNDISKIVYGSLNADDKFIDSTVALESTSVMISRTSKGGHYRPHHDYYSLGHFSTTIFLNDPKEYDGGELSLNYGGDYRNIKLPAGSAVTYDTGTPHCVNEVTRGSRYVAVLWTTSKIADPFMREVCANLSTTLTLIPPKAKTLEEVGTDPHFLVDQTIQKILRAYAKK